MIFPEDASQNLAASLETVVFPPPDGPTSAVTSPCFAVNETSSRIVSLVSYANFTWSNLTYRTKCVDRNRLQPLNFKGWGRFNLF